MTTAVKPSQVDLSVPHFVNCCHHAEAEHALGLYVRTCQVKGDMWQPLVPRDIGQVLKDDVAAGRQPWKSLSTNPVWFPDFHDLVKRGYARWLGEGSGAPVELTDAGYAAIDQHVARVGLVEGCATPGEPT